MADATPAFILLFVVAAILVILIGIANARYQNQREQALIALANKHGFTYLPNGMKMKDPEWSLFGSPPAAKPTAEFSDYFPLFRQGSSKRIEPAIVGTDSKGTTWYLFDYQYEETSNDSTTTYRYSVVIANVPMMLPRMILSEEMGGGIFGKLFGGREMQVESEEFNRRYNIQTDDEKMALDILHPTAIETLLAQPPLEWQMTASYVMLHLRDELSASDYEGLMGCLALFLDKIPNYYRQDYALSGANQ